jgi:cytochrome c
MHKSIAALLVVLGTGVALAESPKLGKPISEADVKQWDIAILPDGSNLPPGQGTPAEGAKGGVAPFYPSLVGGQPLTNGIETPKTIANYYAYATTIFDYTRRAMPYNAPRSLSDNEVYALTAYILSQNKLIGENDVMDAKTLPQVKMPNRDNFIIRFPDRI